MKKTRNNLVKVICVLVFVRVIAGVVSFLLPFLIGALFAVTLAAVIYRRRW